MLSSQLLIPRTRCSQFTLGGGNPQLTIVTVPGRAGDCVNGYATVNDVRLPGCTNVNGECSIQAGTNQTLEIDYTPEISLDGLTYLLTINVVGDDFTLVNRTVAAVGTPDQLATASITFSLPGLHISTRIKGQILRIDEKLVCVMIDAIIQTSSSLTVQGAEL